MNDQMREKGKVLGTQNGPLTAARSQPSEMGRLAAALNPFRRRNTIYLQSTL